MDPNFRTEYAESWTLGVQHMLSSNWAVDSTYFGSKVIGADDSTFSNIPEPGPGPIAARPAESALKRVSCHSLGRLLQFSFIEFEAGEAYSRRIGGERQLCMV